MGIFPGDRQNLRGNVFRQAVFQMRSVRHQHFGDACHFRRFFSDALTSGTGNQNMDVLTTQGSGRNGMVCANFQRLIVMFGNNKYGHF